MDELSSTVYAIVQFDADPDIEGYEGICYYVQDRHCMGFDLIYHGTQVRLMEGVPANIIILYGDFIKNIQAYERGEIEFPCTPYSAQMEESEGEDEAGENEQLSELR